MGRYTPMLYVMNGLMIGCNGCMGQKVPQESYCYLLIHGTDLHKGLLMGFVYHENNRELWSHTLPSYHPGFSITSYNDSTGQRVLVEMCWSVYADPLLRKISKLPPSMILLIQCSNTLLSIVQVLYTFCITFPYLQKSLTYPTLKTDHSSITSTASARNIGVMFYNCDQMRDHITSVCHAPHFHLWNIGSIRHYLTPETYGTLV